MSAITLSRDARHAGSIAPTRLAVIAAARASTAGPDSNPELRKKLVTDGRTGRELVIELVDQHCREAGVTPPLPAESIATIYVALFRGLWEQRVLDPETVPDHLFASAVVFVRDAIETLGTKIP